MHYSTLLYMSAKSITSITITMEANHTRNTHIHTYARAHARMYARTLTHNTHTHIIYDIICISKNTFIFEVDIFTNTIAITSKQVTLY